MSKIYLFGDQIKLLSLMLWVADHLYFDFDVVVSFLKKEGLLKFARKMPASCFNHRLFYMALHML